MRIAITSTAPDLNSQVDPRFGRCAYFLFVDSDTLEFESVENPNIFAGGGAGIQSGQLVANKGARVVLTGSCGPNAFQTLNAAGIQVIVGVTGIVKDAIERYKRGELKPTVQSNVPSHFGMGGGRGMRYQQMSSAFAMPPPSVRPQPTKEQELQILKQQTEYIKQQLDEINKRIDELEKKGE